MRQVTNQKKIPIQRDKITSQDPEVFYQYMKNILLRINQMIADIVDNIQWSPRFFEQDSMPTPDKREIVLWKDTSASSGDPTHYIVIKDPKGNTVSFKSQETA